MSLRFSRNSEANASEFVENLERFIVTGAIKTNECDHSTHSCDQYITLRYRLLCICSTPETLLMKYGENCSELYFLSTRYIVIY